MTAIFLFYIPFSFYHADVLVNIAGVSERELRGLQKTTVFSDTNNVGTLNDRHFMLHVTLHNTMLLLTTTTTVFCAQAVMLRMFKCSNCSSVYVLT